MNTVLSGASILPAESVQSNVYSHNKADVTSVWSPFNSWGYHSNIALLDEEGKATADISSSWTVLSDAVIDQIVGIDDMYSPCPDGQVNTPGRRTPGVDVEHHKSPA